MLSGLLSRKREPSNIVLCLISFFATSQIEKYRSHDASVSLTVEMFAAAASGFTFP